MKTSCETSVLSTKALVAGGLLFNGFWLLAVLGQNDWIGLLAAMLLIVWWRYPAAVRKVLVIALAGCVMDSALTFTGIYRFESSFLPVWLILLWFGFATFVWFLRHNLAGYPAVLVLLAGSVGGAGSYLAGKQLGAVSWPAGDTLTFLIVAVCWLAFSGLLLLWIRSMTKKEV
ncbi:MULTISPECIES: DUF2878 domain-containing protein [Photobacterium]|uniref:Zinc ABC transporter permease n=1 Tax=Photobacterium halotolerans TaxID=265726 RepID=A0A0F5VDQ5_9GAMM|nr:MULTISPECIES: DUF2878 domain-containing protein [Photobacterium]KKC99609.1 hypothetical protein KY46_11810 [Photobacterium halotolerans]UIP29896.1 DUF2878 domain-containing protein [Photobacterium sp. TLY01]